MGKVLILVVEDHPATAQALKRFLELGDYQVEIAPDMQSALKLAPSFHFDVLVCDLNLPDGTGWDLMKRLCEDRPVRGVAFSAFNEPEHVERSKAAGFLEHVVKGSTPEILVSAIVRAAAPLREPAKTEVIPSTGLSSGAARRYGFR